MGKIKRILPALTFLCICMCLFFVPRVKAEVIEAPKELKILDVSIKDPQKKFYKSGDIFEFSFTVSDPDIEIRRFNLHGWDRRFLNNIVKDQPYFGSDLVIYFDENKGWYSSDVDSMEYFDYNKVSVNKSGATYTVTMYILDEQLRHDYCKKLYWKPNSLIVYAPIVKDEIEYIFKPDVDICISDTCARGDHLLYSNSEKQIIKEPTCVAPGSKAYKCLMCETILEDSIESIPATGIHSFNTTYTNPTCEDPGLKIEKCTVCGLEQKEIYAKAYGHVWNKGTLVWPPTCYSTGLKKVKCTVCGMISDVEIPKNDDHIWDEGTVTKPATEKKEGVMTYMCTACGKKRTEPIPKVVYPKAGEKITDEATGYKYKVITRLKTVSLVSSTKKAKTIAIPDTITYQKKVYRVIEIGASACKGNTTVKTVSIGKNIKKIGKNAFNGCTKLTKITGAASVTTIEASAFKGCTALKSVTIPSKVKSIGASAFQNCKKLKTITIQATKLKDTTVGVKAFKGTAAKAKIIVPKKCLKKYSKWLLKKGFSKKATIVSDADAS